MIADIPLQNTGSLHSIAQLLVRTNLRYEPYCVAQRILTGHGVQYGASIAIICRSEGGY